MVKCAHCNVELPPDAPHGVCPKCLMNLGLGNVAETVARRSLTLPPLEELSGLFPQLEVLELRGQGGMGAVFKARQKTLDRIVALKVLPGAVGDDPAFAERFTREARALAKLNHPNIVMVFDFGQVNGLYYFVMEYVDGVNLREAIAAEQLTSSQALAVVSQICDALQYAHDESVIHRDIKPENVLLDKQGRVKIADFGLAKLIDANKEKNFTLTGTQQVVGTMHYMAPEQMERPTEVDHRADIYSLGVVFYEMLTGELPLGRFAPPSRKVDVDVRLDDVVLRALEKERDLRYQRVTDVKTEINSVVTTPAPPTRAPQPAQPVVGPPGLPGRRRLSRFALAGAICTGLSFLGTALLYLSFFGAPLHLNAPARTWMTVNPLIIGGMIGSLVRLAGLGLSIAGWVEIVRSDGRIYGLWLAIPGALLPLTSLLTGSLFFLGRPW